MYLLDKLCVTECCNVVPKVVGYSRLPVASNEDGHLSLEIKKKENEVRAVQQGLVDALHKCLGSKPTLMVCIEGIKPLPDDR